MVSSIFLHHHVIVLYYLLLLIQLILHLAGMTPLQHSCYKGNKEAVQLLIDLVSGLLNYLRIQLEIS